MNQNIKIEALVVAANESAKKIRNYIKKAVKNGCIKNVETLNTKDGEDAHRFTIVNALEIPHIVDLNDNGVAASLVVNGEYVDMNMLK